MRILQICSKPPQPSIDGGCIAMNNITEGLLANGHKVKILTVSTHKHPFVPENLDPSYLENTNIEAVFVDTKINIVDAFSALVTSDSYNISRFFSPDFDKLIIHTLDEQEYDIVQLESLFMTPYIATIRRHSKAKIVLRSHNLEYMIWERMADVSRNTAKKVYLRLLAKQLKRYEVNILQEIDGVAAISREDEKKYKNLGCEKPLITIPFGIELKNYSYKELDTASPLSLFHLGAMDWKPNIEGVSWFIDEIWQAVNEQFDQLKLHLAGRNMPEWLLQDNSTNIEVEGEVDSAMDFMETHPIMIVPLLTAGGMRVKIIEGMAMGRIVISTKIGAEGIDYTSGKNLLIADDKDDFCTQLQLLHDQPELIKSISCNARKLVEEQYNNDKLTQRLIQFYMELQE